MAGAQGVSGAEPCFPGTFRSHLHRPIAAVVFLNQALTPYTSGFRIIKNMLATLEQAANRIKVDVLTVYFAARDPGTPMPVRLLALAAAGYALSPVDLIPDFLPVIGYLDDLVLIPLFILLVIRLTPPEVIESSRARARDVASRPTSRVAAGVIITLWLAAALSLGLWLLPAAG